MAMAMLILSLKSFLIILCIMMAFFVATGHHGIVNTKGPKDKVFNVLRYGAHPGKRDNSGSFVQAWIDACNYRGTARLLIPKGTFLLKSTVFSGPCQGPAPIKVQIVGILKAVPDSTTYQHDFWISFSKINGLVVTGAGTVDGTGSAVWKHNDGDARMPSSIEFSFVENGIIRQITSVNPMGFHISIVECQNIRAKNLHIFAPADSPNTDGIHISQSHQVNVSNTIIGTGDDCIGIIRGSTDVRVRNVTCGPGHGISIGSLGKYEGEEAVRGISVRNCRLSNTTNGIRIKTMGGSRPGQASGILFQDIVMDRVKNPIIIDQYYGNKDSASQVKLSDIRYENIRGTSTSDVGVNIKCSKSVPCERVNLSNINLNYVGEIDHQHKEISSECENAKLNYAGLQLPPACR